MMSVIGPSGGLPDTKFLILSANLTGIYARDDSETANLHAIESIREAFGAEESALFYVNGHGDYRVCMAGASFPLSLAEDRWTSIVNAHQSVAKLSSFGPWALPGMDRSLRFWLSARLYHSGELGGYVFLGGDSVEWGENSRSLLEAVADAIAPIVEVRIQKDIEEANRKKAETLLANNENRLRNFFEGSPDMIYTVGPDDRITSVNASALRFLGRESKQEILNAPFSSFAMHPEDRELFLLKIKDRGIVEDHEIVLLRPNGSTVFCIETAYALKSGNGELLEIQGIVKDISDRIENERNLWRTNLELAEANLKLKKTQSLMVQREKLASIGQLAAGVAHEINNPLGYLISNFATLEKYIRRFDSAWQAVCAGSPASSGANGDAAKLSSTLADAHAIIEESREGFERIRSIVTNLKSFSRSDAGLGFEPYDVNAGLENSLAVAWNEIKYVAEVEKKLGRLPSIRAHGGEINQVFLNILVNAAQAIAGRKKGRKGTIAVETRKEADSVIISIRDDGPGIPKEARNKVFDPFFTTKEPGKGTGLGMSISYDIIVNKHAGSIWLESEPDSGTAFYISLPIDGPPTAEAYTRP
jgi:two-component system, NtrC family, sensor kinase